MTEQKLDHCLQCLAGVQEELRQQQAEQVVHIQQDYNRQLQDLTARFEQQVSPPLASFYQKGHYILMLPTSYAMLF